MISLFSDAYTDVTVDTWRTDWSVATLEDVTIDGSAMKKYSALNFVGIETVSSTIDATDMTQFHLDVWSADFTTFKIKLVDFGADGAEGGGDDTREQVFFDKAIWTANTWITLEFPITLANKNNIGLIIYENINGSSLSNFYLDNIYFYED